jgi:hypothetical protein
LDLSTHVRLFWTMILILTDCFEKSIPLVVGEVVENCVVVFHERSIAPPGVQWGKWWTVPQLDLAALIVLIQCKCFLSDYIHVLRHLNIIPLIIIFTFLIQMNETLGISTNPTCIEVLIIELITRCNQTLNESHVICLN